MVAQFFSDYGRYEQLMAPVQLVFFMLGMGSTLTPRDFVGVVRRPQVVLVGGACQFALSPLIALAIINLFDLEPGIAVGLVLLSAMPSGSLPKLFAYIGKGNLLLSASLDSFGTLVSLVTVPLLMSLLVSNYLPADFQVPLRLVIKELLLFLILPLFAGVGLARRFPRHRHQIPKWCFRIGAAIVVAMIIGSIGSGRARPFAYGWQAPTAVILFCVASQQLSMRPFRLLGWPRADRLSIGLDVTMRNINLGLAVLAIIRESLLERQLAQGQTSLDDGVERVLAGVFWTILFYAGAAAVAGFLVALQFRYAPAEPDPRDVPADSPPRAAIEAEQGVREED